jgi:cobalt-zinc-cadmium efflux system outer membrane protein
MHRRRFPAAGRWPHTARATLTLALAAALTAGLIQAHAQTAVPPAAQDPLTLRGAFEAAWARQPEALALATRRDAARAQAQAAQSWTPEPVAMELSTKTDRLNRNLGTREYEVGVAIPLWLPGERGRSQALADAEGRAVESRTAAAQLRIAAAVREAWWSWQRAHAELEAARGQLENVRRIAADVGKRLKAGDLARADQHQADAAVAAAEGAVAQADGALTVAQQHLRSPSAWPAPCRARPSPSRPLRQLPRPRWTTMPNCLR